MLYKHPFECESVHRISWVTSLIVVSLLLERTISRIPTILQLHRSGNAGGNVFQRHEEKTMISNLFQEKMPKPDDDFIDKNVKTMFFLTIF